MEKFYKKLKAVLSSSKFFWSVIAFFVFESLWLALTNKFPGIFDEYYHFGIIQTYAHQWSPFFSHQPAGTSYLGPLTVDPSFLFHYILSFPDKLVAYFTSSVAAQVITLRLFNVAFFAGGLILFNRLFKYSKVPKAVVNLVFLFMTLIPIVPFLASQINYDNLLFLLTPLALLLTVKLVRKLEEDGKINWALFSWLLFACVVASCTVFNFLPIFLAIAIYVFWKIRQFKGSKPALQYLSQSTRTFNDYRLWQRVGLGLVVLVSLGLLVKSYGYDVIKYHTPTPQCNQVLSFDDCKAYGPWYRNYEFAQAAKNTQINLGKVMGYSLFSGGWWYNMLHELAETGGLGAGARADNIITPWVAINFFAVTGIVLGIYYFRKIMQDRQLAFLLMVLFFYFGALWLLNFKDFMKFSQLVAVQGRYIVVLLPVILLLVAELVRLFLLRSKPYVKLAVFLVVLLAMLNGGGAACYILRSNQSIWWNNRAVIKANHGAQKVLQHLTHNPLGPI